MRARRGVFGGGCGRGVSRVMVGGGVFFYSQCVNASLMACPSCSIVEFYEA